MKPLPIAIRTFPLRRAAQRLVLGAALAFAAALAPPTAAYAARVSGKLVSYHGQPAPSRDLHFENCVSRDIYLAPTHGDGSFAQTLPPGCYNLRAERGAILKSSIEVGAAPVDLGQVSDLAPRAPARLFDLQSIFPSLLYSPAPSTAYIFTRDTTVVPASAPKIPAPGSEGSWVRMRRENEMGVGANSFAAATRRQTGNPTIAGAPDKPAADYNPPVSFGPQSSAGSPPQP